MFIFYTVAGLIIFALILGVLAGIAASVLYVLERIPRRFIAFLLWAPGFYLIAGAYFEWQRMPMPLFIPSPYEFPWLISPAFIFDSEVARILSTASLASSGIACVSYPLLPKESLNHALHNDASRLTPHDLVVEIDADVWKESALYLAVLPWIAIAILALLSKVVPFISPVFLLPIAVFLVMFLIVTAAATHLTILRQSPPHVLKTYYLFGAIKWSKYKPLNNAAWACVKTTPKGTRLFIAVGSCDDRIGVTLASCSVSDDGISAMKAKCQQIAAFLGIEDKGFPEEFMITEQNSAS